MLKIIKSNRITLVWKASGFLDAQLIKNYLESFGLHVFTFEESIGFAYGLTSTPLGEVEVYVLNEEVCEAQRQLELFLSGSGDNQES